MAKTSLFGPWLEVKQSRRGRKRKELGQKERERLLRPALDGWRREVVVNQALLFFIFAVIHTLLPRDL